MMSSTIYTYTHTHARTHMNAQRNHPTPPQRYNLCGTTWAEMDVWAKPAQKVSPNTESPSHCLPKTLRCVYSFETVMNTFTQGRVGPEHFNRTCQKQVPASVSRGLPEGKTECRQRFLSPWDAGHQRGAGWALHSCCPCCHIPPSDLQIKPHRG